MVRESQAERTEKIRNFLSKTPNVPHDSRSIRRATGVPKRLIDYKRSLSRDPIIRRENFVHPETRRRRVYWTYVDAGRQSSEAPDPENLVFSAWHSWADRRNLTFAADDLRAGIYLLSHFEGPPARSIAPSATELPAEVFYVGMSKNLNNRPLRDHTGGRRRYHDLNKNDAQVRKLYVSVCPVFAVGCPDHELQYARIQYLEMKLAWQYTSRHRKPLHYKKRRTASK
jgi:hypothetical protein